VPGAELTQRSEAEPWYCETELPGSLRPDVIVIHAIQHVKLNFDASAKQSQLLFYQGFNAEQTSLVG
jgi:hypothetical protein